MFTCYKDYDPNKYVKPESLNLADISSYFTDKKGTITAIG